MYHTESAPTNAFRVSFNTAEADLRFGSHGNGNGSGGGEEVFSIPEGLEEFLASHFEEFDAGEAGMGALPAFSSLIGPW